MRPKEKIPIDPDIWQNAAAYVEEQCAVIEKYGNKAVTAEEKQDATYKVAEYPQILRNMEQKLARSWGGKQETKPVEADEPFEL